MSSDLVEKGLPLELTYNSDEARPFGFAYHSQPDGVLLELIDAVREPEFAEWIGAAV